jgi:hypothetical protein
VADASPCFPALWRVGKIAGGHLVRDADGHVLAYLYSRDDWQMKMLTTRLPDLLGKGERD